LIANRPLDDRPPLSERVIPFSAGDGFPCNLIHVEGRIPTARGPVLLVHGAGVRANIFRAPVETHIVRYLIEQGYDVWLENWRASIDLTPNSWTLDQAALYDHPRAVRRVLEETGQKTLKAIIHCQGSTSFMMSAMAGLIPEVTNIVSNAVSFCTVIPWFSKMKILYGTPIVGWLTPFMNPQWGLKAPTLTAKMLNAVIELSHRECNNPVCKWSSFTYGSGHPTLWRHENLNDDTHEWVKQEFANVPITFFSQMARCVKVGHLVPVDGTPGLPADLSAQAPKTQARVSFFAGRDNLCFLPASQEQSHAFFQASGKTSSLHVVDGYGHLDMFIGKNASKDIYPLMVEELNK
jgi:pimeloyl-ACP methyl ester carboxylesterase